MGAIYLMHESEKSNDEAGVELSEKKAYLQLQGAYAYTPNSGAYNHVEKGAGLIGQCWADKKVVYLTDVPAAYSEIGSGLGASSPSYLLIVPLLSNQYVQGVIELSSFEPMDEFTIRFVTKLAETIASSIIAIRSNFENTTRLIRSRALTHQLQKQEEELKQNALKLEMTQEEMQRSNAILNHRMRAVERVVGKVEFDVLGQIINKEELKSRMKDPEQFPPPLKKQG